MLNQGTFLHTVYYLDAAGARRTFVAGATDTPALTCNKDGWQLQVGRRAPQCKTSTAQTCKPLPQSHLSFFSFLFRLFLFREHPYPASGSPEFTVTIRHSGRPDRTVQCTTLNSTYSRSTSTSTGKTMTLDHSDDVGWQSLRERKTPLKEAVHVLRGRDDRLHTQWSQDAGQ